MKKVFKYEFEDRSPYGIDFEYVDMEDIKERIIVKVEDGVPTIFANKEAYLFLARLCAKFALGDHYSGFYVNLEENFDGNNEMAIRLVLKLESE